MKKRLLSLLLALVMLVGMIPATAMTANAGTSGWVYVGGVFVSDGTYLANGATTTTTTKPSVGYAYLKDGTLTLHNYEYEGIGYDDGVNDQTQVIIASNIPTIILEGENTLVSTGEKDGFAIYCHTGDLTIKGSGSLTCVDKGNGKSGIWASVGSITIESGTIDVKGYSAPITSNAGDIFINGGTIVTEGDNDGLAAFDGDVTINGGDITVSGRSGISARYNLTVNGGRVEAFAVKTSRGDPDSALQCLSGARNISIADGLNVYASKTVDGPLVSYENSNNSKYDYVLITSDVLDLDDYILVGGVRMLNDTYLANGANYTSKTKPSGGYAYYKDGTLTLNNYSYTGEGYYCDPESGGSAIIYASNDIQIELVGTNNLTQVDYLNSACIRGEANVSLIGAGTLNLQNASWGIVCESDLSIESCNLNVDACELGIYSVDQEVIFNGGSLKIDATDCAVYGFRGIEINGGSGSFRNTQDSVYCVLHSRGTVTIDPSLVVMASTTADGELSEYVAANLASYKKIVIENTVNVSATWSGTPKDATTSTKGAAVTATKWYKKNGSSWTELTSSDTIKEGNTYRCEVTVGTTGTYTLADGYTVKINGIAATKKSGNTWYVDRTITGYRDYVDITDIPLPEKGAKPDFNTYDIQSGYTNFGMIEWYKCDKDGKIIGDALTEDDVFEADSYYRLEVTVVPYENYLFDTTNLSFFINLKGVNYYYPHKDKYPNSVTGWKVYHVDDANGTYTIQIGDITLKDGDYLANNATSVTTVKPVGGYAYYKDGVLTLNNFVAAKLVRYYERYLEVELIGENKIGAIADYYYWGGNASNNYYTGLEFRGDGNLELAGAYKPYSNISVNGDVFFNGSGDILLDAEICCFQYTENVIINDGYVYCYTSQDSVFMGSTIIEVNGGKLKMLDGGSWNDFTCNGTLTIAAGSVYVSADPSKTELADCVLWDGVTDLNTYDCVWIVEEQAADTHTHSLTTVPAKAATCKAAGNKAYYTCECGKWFTDSSATKEITDKNSVIIAKLTTHSYDSGTITTQPTCKAEGVKTYKCTVCGATKTEAVAVDKNAHPSGSIIILPAKESTCAATGLTPGEKCTHCGVETIPQIETPKLDHEYDNACDAECNNCPATRTPAAHKGGTATCTEKAVCIECGVKYGELASHNYAAATCTKAKTCTVCKATSGSALGHKWVAATCTKAKTCSVCKATSGSALGHKWVAATCTKAKTCSVCKATSGKALGHTYKNITTKATLTKNGKVVTKCSVCGNVSKTTTVYYPKTIKLSKTDYTYNGKVQTPSVTVKDSKGNTLKKDTDYTVKYESGRKSPGKYTVTVTFKGKYTGTKKLYFTIAPKATSKITASQTTTTITLKWTAVTGADGYRVYKYNTKTKKYEKLKDVTKNTLKISKLKAGTAYKYKVRAFTKDDGTIYGSYSDVFETATKCKTPSIKKLSSSKKGIASFTWSNVSGETGYQVYYSTKKDSGYKKVASYKTNAVKGSKTKLKSGKKYYFKVRAYKKTASGTVYSSWSAVKSVKIK